MLTSTWAISWHNCLWSNPLWVLFYFYLQHAHALTDRRIFFFLVTILCSETSVTESEFSVRTRWWQESKIITRMHYFIQYRAYRLCQATSTTYDMYCKFSRVVTSDSSVWFLLESSAFMREPGLLRRNWLCRLVVVIFVVAWVLLQESGSKF